MDEETSKKVDAEIANIIAMSGKLNAEAGKLSAETMKINSENRYYPIIVTATATLAIVGLARLFFAD